MVLHELILNRVQIIILNLVHDLSFIVELSWLLTSINFIVLFNKTLYWISKPWGLRIIYTFV